MDAHPITMRVGILTSSRADYGIYRPLLKAIREDPSMVLTIIAFGTHLSPYHGNTIDTIVEDGFDVKYRLNTLLANDDENSISSSFALASFKFAEFWDGHSNEFDIVFCLGDRFEMFAAVAAGIPYQIRFAHIHGGETTLGAIDNVYRHSITLSSTIHFVAHETFAKRVSEITGGNSNIFVIGALSLDNLLDLKILTIQEFRDRWRIDLSKPTVLVTIHPETVNSKLNQAHFLEVADVLRDLGHEFQIVVTMPNADTGGSIFRSGFQHLKQEMGANFHLVENFGSLGYFSCMAHSAFLFGNTSSGIIEAATFKKYVLNIGDRQKGRLMGPNILNVPFDGKMLRDAIAEVRKLGMYTGDNVYFKGGAVRNIINALKQIGSVKYQ